MQTYFLSDEAEDLPLACTIAGPQHTALTTGTIWAFYPHRCLLESDRPLTPGMRVSLSLHLSDTARVQLGLGIVTWARAKKCGIEFPHSSAATAFEKVTLAAPTTALTVALEQC